MSFMGGYSQPSRLLYETQYNRDRMKTDRNISGGSKITLPLRLYDTGSIDIVAAS